MKFVAVTSCPTGIAHSQMAAEGIEQAAEKLGHEIKVEIQGAMGAENELTADDVASADAVIIAADTSVSEDRFEDKPIVNRPVKDGINDAEALIQSAVEKAGGEPAATTDEVASAESEAQAAELDEAAEPEAEPTTASEPTSANSEEKDGGLIAWIKSLFEGAAKP